MAPNEQTCDVLVFFYNLERCIYRHYSHLTAYDIRAKQSLEQNRASLSINKQIP